MDQLPRPKTSDGDSAPEGPPRARVLRIAPARGAFSRETLAQWARWMRASHARKGDTFAVGAGALAVHALLALALFALPKRKEDIDLDARNRQVKVSFFEGRGKANEPIQKGEEVSAPRTPSSPATRRAAPKGDSVKRADAKPVPAPPAPSQRVPLTRDPSESSAGPFAVPAPDVSVVEPSPGPIPDAAGIVEEAPATQVAPSTTSKGLRNLLPGGSRDYLERQRTIGDVMGQGPIGGDVPEPISSPDPEKRPIIVEREYALSHYFDTLSRRFSDAWGPERTLPPNSSFAGVTGEFIEYDIVVNRDGSLRKITNVTALRQTWRRFDDVDRIVLDVFSNVFPLNAVPDRILQDPVVIRKRIQYTGYRYSIF